MNKQKEEKAVAVVTEERSVMEEMRKRVDRLMKQVQLGIDDGDLRVELITRLLEVRRLLNGERSEPGS